MINKEELRIGNIVLRNGHLFEVWDLKRKELELDNELLDRHVNYCTYDEIEGVPLSKEALGRLGFEIVEFRPPTMNVGMDRFYGYDYANIKIGKGTGNSDNLTIRVYKDEKFILDGYYCIRFQYVHQIQNLFFIMNNCKEELKYYIGE